MTSKELFAESKKLRDQAEQLSSQAIEKHTAELLEKPVAERIIYAAYDRCPCGAGMAYDPVATDPASVFKGPLAGYWDCSAIILGTEDKSVKHTAQLPFSFYELKSEQQPSANGATTRPKKPEK